MTSFDNFLIILQQKGGGEIKFSGIKEQYSLFTHMTSFSLAHVQKSRYRKVAIAMTRKNIASSSSHHHHRVIASSPPYHRDIANRISVIALLHHRHRSIDPNLVGPIVNYLALSGFNI